MFMTQASAEKVYADGHRRQAETGISQRKFKGKCCEELESNKTATYCTGYKGTPYAEQNGSQR